MAKRNQKQLLGMYIIALGLILAGTVAISSAFTGRAIGGFQIAPQNQSQTPPLSQPTTNQAQLIVAEPFSNFYTNVVLYGSGLPTAKRTQDTFRAIDGALENGGTVVKP